MLHQHQDDSRGHNNYRPAQSRYLQWALYKYLITLLWSHYIDHLGRTRKSCCSSNTDSSHGSTELCSLWPHIMELDAGRIKNIPLESFKSKLKTYLYEKACDQW